MKKIVLLFSFSSLVILASAQKFEQLAQTPPMGWNSWNKFQCDVSEQLIMKMADAMAASGLKDAGYQYIVIDDCWQVSRDADGNIVVDEKRFPHGIKYLADYIHSKGLKLGIYSCAGTLTCQGRPGGRGYEFQDARSYARWGVDYLKYDWCYSSTQNAPASYSLMRDALYKAGRPMVFSLCEWGNNKPWEWAASVGHLWRTTEDISDNWNSMISIAEKQRNLTQYAGPGHWNDPDMLEVGNGGMTTEEYKTHFSLWCMLSAPLMAGNDLSAMDGDTRSILMNKEVIALDQDSLGKQAYCFRDNNDYQIWIKPLVNHEKAVCLLNKSDEKKEVLVDFQLLARLHWGDPSNTYLLSDYRVRDLWEHKNVSLKNSSVYVTLPPHSVKVYRFVSSSGSNL